jgi:hypothetical protein
MEEERENSQPKKKKNKARQKSGHCQKKKNLNN